MESPMVHMETEQAKRIRNLLNHGEENAQTRRDLMRITGMEDRQIRRAINTLRRLGNCILSSSKMQGYYFPSDGEQGALEAKRFVLECKSIISEMETIMQPAADYLKFMERAERIERHGKAS